MPAWANNSKDPISKTPSQKRAGGVAQGIGPEFKPQYHKKEKKRMSLSFQKSLKFKDVVMKFSKNEKQLVGRGTTDSS
jgi:hypothetical protein